MAVRTLKPHEKIAPTNNLHFTGGQGVVGSNPASPTNIVEST